MSQVFVLSTLPVLEYDSVEICLKGVLFYSGADLPFIGFPQPEAYWGNRR